MGMPKYEQDIRKIAILKMLIEGTSTQDLMLAFQFSTSSLSKFLTRLDKSGVKVTKISKTPEGFYQLKLETAFDIAVDLLDISQEALDGLPPRLKYNHKYKAHVNANKDTGKYHHIDRPWYILSH